MEITGQIQRIKYNPIFADKDFPEYDISELKRILPGEPKFFLRVDNVNKFAVSRWVSPKRTRSYPYARVYDTLFYTGKRVAVIPIYKDEGKDGDRDFLQWDTISLMSLLGVNVIISYYKNAEKSPRYKDKITRQSFDSEQILYEMKKLVSYQSDALHWNLEQADNIYHTAKKAVESYEKISFETGVKMHSEQKISVKINLFKENKDNFMNMSRKLSKEAQKREFFTTQPKENINIGEKSTITIKNYLGGYYYFTTDEARIINENGNININLVEAKHSSNKKLPSLDDIKDGLLKMILYTNLKKVEIDSDNKDDKKEYAVKPILKLTSAKSGKLSLKQENILNILKEEAALNGFAVEYKGRDSL